MNKFLDFIRRSIILIFGMVITEVNIIIGITILPEIVKIAQNKYIPLIVSLGILFQAIVTMYFTFKYGFMETQVRCEE